MSLLLDVERVTRPTIRVQSVRACFHIKEILQICTKPLKVSMLSMCLELMLVAVLHKVTEATIP